MSTTATFVYRHSCKLGYEGIVSKRLGSPHASHIQCVALIKQEIDWHAD